MMTSAADPAQPGTRRHRATRTGPDPFFFPAETPCAGTQVKIREKKNPVRTEATSRVLSYYLWTGSGSSSSTVLRRT